MCVSMCIYVCARVFLHVCMCGIHVYMYACKYVCVCIRALELYEILAHSVDVYVCVYVVKIVCMYLCMYLCMVRGLWSHKRSWDTPVCMRM